jgi:hypothetical protein
MKWFDSVLLCEFPTVEKIVQGETWTDGEWSKFSKAEFEVAATLDTGRNLLDLQPRTEP